MKLEDRLSKHFARTADAVPARLGRLDVVVAASNSMPLAGLLKAGLLATGLAALGVVGTLTGWWTLFSQLEEQPPTRIVVSPYIVVTNRLASEDVQPVFTVASEAPSYWRMASLETYEDGIWKFAGEFDPVSPGIDPESTAGGNRITVRQEFEIAGLDTIWVPAAAEPIVVTADKDTQIQTNRASNTMAVAAEHPDSNGMAYTIVSSIAVPTPDQLRAAPPTNPDTTGPNSMSTTGFSDDIRDLADRLDDDNRTGYDNVLAVRDHFQSYTHTADPTVERTGTSDNEPLPSDPTVAFLVTREGSAQQFASAFAQVVRELGMPSRVAVGFTPGTVQSPTDSDLNVYEVSNQHAHAWPEVYFEGIGWVAFEPTPGHDIP